jgi:hypothetical protein
LKFEIKAGIGENKEALEKAREEINEYLARLGYLKKDVKAVVLP